MDRVEDVGMNRRGFLKFLAVCSSVVVGTQIPEAFAGLARDVDSIRRHPMVKINLRDGGVRVFNLDVTDVDLVVDLETYWGGSFSDLRDGFGSSRILNTPTYCLHVKDTGTHYLSTKTAYEYENDDPEEFYTIILNEAVEQRKGENYRRMDVVGGAPFFVRDRDD